MTGDAKPVVCLAAVAGARSEMSNPCKARGRAPTADGRGVVTLGRADTGLYAPLREIMVRRAPIAPHLGVGDRAPDFFLPDDAANLVSLGGLLESGSVALCFLGGSWCTFCVNRLKAIASLSARGRFRGTVVGITPEVGAFPRRMREDHQIVGPLLCDVDYGVGLAFGLMFAVPADLAARLDDRGIPLPALHGVAHPMLTLPAVYVVEPSRRIVMADVATDYGTGVDLEAIAAAMGR